MAYSTTSDRYTLSNVPFTPGDGKIFKLVRNTAQVVKTIEDANFAAANSEGARGVADISAVDGRTAMKIGDDSNSRWDFYAPLSGAGLTAGTTYDIYARVKVRYKTDMYADERNGPSFPLPSGNAFTAGVKNSSGTDIAAPITTAAGTMENMFWTNVKIGTKQFTAAQLTGTNAYVYLQPANNMANIESIYVDQFFFIQK